MPIRPRGTGWSELQPGVQDAENIAIELYQVLKQAGEKERFVPGGSVSRGYYARQHVDAFPTEVAGLVLVDFSTPEQITEIPGFGYSPVLIKGSILRSDWSGGKRLAIASRWALLSGGCKRHV